VESVSAKQARQKFAQLVKKAQGGTSVVITRRGRDVAKLGPAAKPKSRGFPDMAAFRASLGAPDKRPNGTIETLRRRERY